MERPRTERSFLSGICARSRPSNRISPAGQMRGRARQQLEHRHHGDALARAGFAHHAEHWTLTERDGKLFGRGACDMKGFDALALHTMARASRLELKRPLQLALSFDEEVGCAAVIDLVEAMRDVLPKASAVLVGEPSMMKVVTGHKGGLAYHVHVRGFEVHSSLLPYGVSAIMESAKLIDWANQKNAENAARSPSELAAPFDPPFTTLHVGMIEGGTAHNITAKDCKFFIEFRFVPGESPEDWARAIETKAAELSAEMQKVHPDTGFDLTPGFALPALTPESDGEAELLARRLTGDNGRHVVSYGTEGSQFQTRGYSTVICGPGDIAQAHQPDEFLSLEQLRAGEAFMDRLLAQLCD
jgi:acetylornithine deacetylase